MRYVYPSIGFGCGARDWATLFSNAALRPSIVSAFGSLTPFGSLTLAFRAKFRFCGIMARAGALPSASGTWIVRRARAHLKLLTVNGELTVVWKGIRKLTRSERSKRIFIVPPPRTWSKETSCSQIRRLRVGD